MIKFGLRQSYSYTKVAQLVFLQSIHLARSTLLGNIKDLTKDLVCCQSNMSDFKNQVHSLIP